MIQRCIFLGIIAAVVCAGYGLYVLGIDRAVGIFLVSAVGLVAIAVLFAVGMAVYGYLKSLWVFAGKLARKWETKGSV